MITKEEAMNCHYRQEIHHTTAKQGGNQPYRVFVTGKCKTWKRDADRFELPYKHGLYGPCGYITERNAADWRVA